MVHQPVDSPELTAYADTAYSVSQKAVDNLEYTIINLKAVDFPGTWRPPLKKAVLGIANFAGDPYSLVTIGDGEEEPLIEFMRRADRLVTSGFLGAAVGTVTVFGLGLFFDLNWLLLATPFAALAYTLPIVRRSQKVRETRLKM